MKPVDCGPSSDFRFTPVVIAREKRAIQYSQGSQYDLRGVLRVPAAYWIVRFRGR